MKVNSILTAVIVLLLSPVLQAQHSNEDYPNPWISQRADPWVYLHTDGYYYFTGTVPEYDRLILRRAQTLNELETTEEKVIWKKHETGIMGSHIWAPELHYIDNKWYIYFAAGGAEDVWAIRMYVLENSSPNPMEGEWVEKGQITTKYPIFSLDATTFEHKGTRYLAWAERPDRPEAGTSIFIAEMENPWTIKQPQAELTIPELDWEIQMYKVNEGAAVIKRNGKIFMTYSASATNDTYAMGLLTADEDADLLDPESWTKSLEPVFKSSEENGIYGPGHNSFTTTKDGKTDLLIYHARSYKELEVHPLNDPNRHARIQVLQWDEDGNPYFGKPRPDTRSFE